MKNYKIDVVTNVGRSFRAVLIPTGGQSDNYNLGVAKESMIEFYDLTHSHTRDGQFTGARYYVSTLMDSRGWNPIKAQNGINLNGGVSDWVIDHETFENILDWVHNLLYNLEINSS